MKLGMTIAQVDALLAGHPRKEDRTRYESAGARPITLAIMYDDKPGAMEGDYFLTVYFDEDGRLTGSEINEYLN